MEATQKEEKLVEDRLLQQCTGKPCNHKEACLKQLSTVTQDHIAFAVSTSLQDPGRRRNSDTLHLLNRDGSLLNLGFQSFEALMLQSLIQGMGYDDNSSMGSDI